MKTLQAEHLEALAQILVTPERFKRPVVQKGGEVAVLAEMGLPSTVEVPQGD